MARNLHANDHQLLEDEEDYIDMDITSTTSRPNSREFEFHLSTITIEKEPITSPADELFYRGKLLPLHLPPRIQMVEKILSNHSHVGEESEFSEEIPISATTATDTNSCSVSGELTSSEASGELTSSEDLDTKRPWAKKLQHMKQSSLSHKLKASGAYLRSFFSKSACSDESKESTSGFSKAGRKSPFWQIRGGRDGINKGRSVAQPEEPVHQRKSFSGAINHHMQAKSSPSSSCSSSCCSSSPSSSLVPMMQRSNSVSPEGENSIQGAIAYCKSSLVPGRKSASDVGHNSFSVAKVAAACEKIDRPSFSRG